MKNRKMKRMPPIYGPQEYAFNYVDAKGRPREKTDKDIIKGNKLHIFWECYKNVYVEYLQNSSLVGSKNVVDPKRTRFERIIWFIALVTIIGSIVYISLINLWEVLSHPTVVTFESNQHPIWSVNFPSVTICSANKISAAKAKEYANNLSLASGRPAQDIFENLHFFGRLLNPEIREIDKMMSIMDFVLKYDENYTTLDLLDKLMPSCDEMLISCKFKGRKRDCNLLFKRMITSEGFCCLFNVAIPALGMNVTPTVVRAPGDIAGLSVILNSKLEDYFYTIFHAEGFHIRIQNPLTYPDASSGHVVSTFARPDHETRISLTPNTLISVRDVRKFPISRRGCIFKDELPEFRNQYSFSNCISVCRLQKLIEICECVPFYLKLPTVDIKVCNLNDVPCLYRNKKKLFLVFTEIPTEKSMINDFNEALDCTECYPDCETTTYYVKTSYVPLSSHNLENFFVNSVGDVKNASIVHVFYNNYDGYLYKMDVFSYWFEIISNMGGISSLFLGLSLISVAEFIFFLTFRLTQRLWENGFFTIFKKENE